MNLRQLEVFQAVMYGGTTKNAARLLGITQRVVSNLVRQLEDRLGFSLFDRIGGRLHPTLEAKVLSKNLARVFARVAAVRNLVDDLRHAQGALRRRAAKPCPPPPRPSRWALDLVLSHSAHRRYRQRCLPRTRRDPTCGHRGPHSASVPACWSTPVLASPWSMSSRCV